jgi:hypothetical protein
MYSIITVAGYRTMWKKMTCPVLKNICLDELIATMQHLSQESRPPERKIESEIPQHEAGTVTTRTQSTKGTTYKLSQYSDYGLGCTTEVTFPKGVG